MSAARAIDPLRPPQVRQPPAGRCLRGRLAAALHRHAAPAPARLLEVALITDGRGALALDGEALEVAPYRVCITAPGEIRSWRLEGARLGGLLAFFEPELFDEAFADPHFVASLPLVGAGAARALVRRRAQALRCARRHRRDDARRAARARRAHRPPPARQDQRAADRPAAAERRARARRQRARAARWRGASRAGSTSAAGATSRCRATPMRSA